MNNYRGGRESCRYLELGRLCRQRNSPDHYLEGIWNEIAFFLIQVCQPESHVSACDKVGQVPLQLKQVWVLAGVC
jgi:hypothetical protein